MFASRPPAEYRWPFRIPEAAPPKPCGCVARLVYVPAAGAVPLMTPVAVLIVRPVGRLVALYEVGEFEAAIYARAGSVES